MGIGTTAFKKMFGVYAKSYGWNKVKGGWKTTVLDRRENIIAIEIQRSNYGKLFYVGIKVFVRELSPSNIDESLDLSSSTEQLYRRQPKEFDDILDLTSSLSEFDRELGLRRLFDFLADFTEKAKTCSGLVMLESKGELFVQPHLRTEIQRIAQGVSCIKGVSDGRNSWQ